MHLRYVFLLLLSVIAVPAHGHAKAAKPNVILVMTDDQGWGETGYNGHPHLATPHLDAMAANGMRFDRFYAAAPVCSPTRASILTGRSPFRTGVFLHGLPLRLQERTIAQAMRSAGYATAHMGKWHLDGLRGPGVPILGTDSHHPGEFGFEHWISSTNYFDFDPILSNAGTFEMATGEASAAVFSHALKFIESMAAAHRPFFLVLWVSAPHKPFLATSRDRESFADLDEESQHHYGELVAFDRELGNLRQALRDWDLAKNTILWFCSDNGGLPDLAGGTTGGLRGFKASLWEGGLRVPAIIEWPGHIQPGSTAFPAATFDIFPTLADILDLPVDRFIQPIDGISLREAIWSGQTARSRPLGFLFRDQAAFIDGRFKLIRLQQDPQAWALFDLENDPAEEHDCSDAEPEQFKLLKSAFDAWRQSVDASVAGKDYPEGTVLPGESESLSWWDHPAYAPWLPDWRDRPDYREVLLKAVPPP
ncbi:MAG: Arylsulfatase precursor [Verrucomicrobiota bacterium]